MSSRNQTHAASRYSQRIPLSNIENAALRFWRRIPPALLASWFVLSLLLATFALWQDRAMPSVGGLLSGDFQLSSIYQLLAASLTALVISMVRTALYLPAKCVNDGQRVSPRAVWRMAASRLPTLVSLSLTLGVLSALVGVLVFLVNPSLSLWSDFVGFIASCGLYFALDSNDGG